MTKKDIVLRITFSVLVFSVAVLSIFYQLARLCTDTPLMQNQFIAYSKTEYTQEKYKIIAEDISQYLSGKKEKLDMAEPNQDGESLISEREILHMKDVRGLVKTGLAFLWPILLVLLVFLVLLLAHKKGLMYISSKTVEASYLIGVGAFLLLLTALAVAYLGDFDGLFEAFHRLLFTNDLWLLNENEDILLQLMPEPFFKSYAGIFLKRFLPLVACLAMGCFAIIFKGKNKDAK
ncbi:MAG: TIGR01906 family membrane protein [Eubacteriales bacterium]|nr:TIGR01906 family membrane protein [Eubacteriales bacterium]